MACCLLDFCCCKDISTAQQRDIRALCCACNLFVRRPTVTVHPVSIDVASQQPWLAIVLTMWKGGYARFLVQVCRISANKTHPRFKHWCGMNGIDFFPSLCAIGSPLFGYPLALDVLDVVGRSSSSSESKHKSDSGGSSQLFVAAQAAGSAESEREAWKMCLEILCRGNTKPTIFTLSVTAGSRIVSFCSRLENPTLQHCNWRVQSDSDRAAWSSP